MDITQTIDQIQAIMFRSTEYGMIKQESIDSWAQNVHLAFIENTDDHWEVQDIHGLHLLRREPSASSRRRGHAFLSSPFPEEDMN